MKPLTIHLYNPDTKEAYCGMVIRGNITRSRKEATCLNCDLQWFIAKEKLRCQRIASQ